MDRLQSLLLSFLYAVVIAGTLVATVSIGGLPPVHAQSGGQTFNPSTCGAPAQLCPGLCAPGGTYPHDVCAQDPNNPWICICV
jgi:hypothetical protein